MALRPPRLEISGPAWIQAGRVHVSGLRLDVEIRMWLARQKAKRGHLSDVDLRVVVELAPKPKGGTDAQGS